MSVKQDGLVYSSCLNLGKSSSLNVAVNSSHPEMQCNLEKTNDELKTSECQEMVLKEEKQMKRKKRCKFDRRKKRMLMTESEREAWNKKFREYRKEYRRNKQMQESEMQRTIRLEHQKEANYKYSKAKQMTPEEYLAWLQSERVRSKRRILEETPEQRQKRLEHKRSYYHSRRQNMTPEEKEAKRQRDREYERNQRRRLPPKFIGDHLDSEVNSAFVPDGSMENKNQNSVGWVTNRPARIAKKTAKIKSRYQLNTNFLSLKEREHHSSEQPSIQNQRTNIDKLKLRAVVILERIRVNELALNISGKTTDFSNVTSQ